MRHKTYFGKILYLSDGVGEEGREYFIVTVQPDGSRTLRALCEMDNDHLVRDVTYSLGPEWRPQECYVRLTIRESLHGSALFRFFDDRIECDASTVAEGRIRQALPLDGVMPSFGAHPVCCDTWHAKVGDLLRGDQSRVHMRNIGLSSPLPNGGSGPLASLTELDVEFVAAETISTLAGEFETKHMRNWGGLREGPNNSPVEIWAYSDDFIPIRARWDLLGQTYELVELRVVESSAFPTSPMGDSLTRMAKFNSKPS